MKKLQGFVKGFQKESNTFRVVASSGSRDRQGEVLNPNGWELGNFVKNPVLLWSHDAHQLPIGKVANVYVEGNNLIADTEFAEEQNPFAKMVADLVRGGFLNAVSVGFMPLEYDNEGNVLKQELLELSYVNVPANQDALLSNEYKAFQKSLEAAEKTMPVVEKEGRVFSEKNRSQIRGAIEAMSTATVSLNTLLEATEKPDEPKKHMPKPKAMPDPLRHIERVAKLTRKAVKLVEAATEHAAHTILKGGATQ